MNLLKWVGGKRRLLPHLLPLAGSFTDYVEPFVGGGALFFALAEQGRITRATLADANPHLIATYRGVQADPEGVAERYAEHAAQHAEGYYLALRKAPPSAPVDAAAWMLYLNRAGFNGLWRVNKQGEYNVPWGKRADVAPEAVAEAIQAASRLLQGVTLLHQPWAASVALAGPGALVYADPPYIPLTASRSFTGYAAGGFPDAEQVALRDALLHAHRRGARVIASNSGAPRALELYADFNTQAYDLGHSVAAKGAGRGTVKELIAWR